MKKHSPSKQKVDVNHYPWYAARFWDGMCVGTWWQLLRRNRFAFSLSRFPTASMTFIANPINSICAAWQALRWQKKVERFSIDESPVFVLGHWRSGTTLLHELLAADERYAPPTTYDCFAPTHFLSTRPLFTRCLRFLVPQQRPMDNMVAGWDRPQEEEFALMNMGAPSVYRMAAFPNHGPTDLDSLDFQGWNERQVREWKEKFVWFLKCVSVREQRPLVLKSPPHLGRIKVLREIFPDARFIHIVRDPHVVFPSTVRLWRSLFETQGLQVPRCTGLEELVFDIFSRLYASFEKDRARLPESQFAEIRYEDLVENPVQRMQEIYAKLDLGDFQAVRPAMQQYLEARSDYQTNRYQVAEQTREQIGQRWSSYITRYGYDV